MHTTPPHLMHTTPPPLCTRPLPTPILRHSDRGGIVSAHPRVQQSPSSSSLLSSNVFSHHLPNTAINKSVGKGLGLSRQPLSPVAWDEHSSFAENDNNSQIDNHAHPNEAFRYQLPGEDRSKGGMNNGRFGYGEENVAPQPQQDARYVNILIRHCLTLFSTRFPLPTHNIH